MTDSSPEASQGATSDAGQGRQDSENSENGENGPSFTGGDAGVEIYMAEAVVFVPPEATLRDAARLMMSSAVGALVVGSAHDAQGVVSERDLARAVAEDLDPDLTPVGDLASRELVWCDLSATVSEVTTLMMERYVRHVLVEEAAELKGIVSARDLLGAYAV